MNKSKAAVTISKTIGFVQMLGGIAILFLFGICTIMCLCDEEYLADAGVSFLIVCLILMRWVFGLSFFQKEGLS